MNNRQKKDLVWLRHGGRCFYCGDLTWQFPWSPGCHSRKMATMDHIHLKCENGSKNYSNYVLACEDCNNDRSNQDAVEYFMKRTKEQDPAEVYHRILSVVKFEEELRAASIPGSKGMKKFIKEQREALEAPMSVRSWSNTPRCKVA